MLIPDLLLCLGHAARYPGWQYYTQSYLLRHTQDPVLLARPRRADGDESGFWRTAMSSCLERPRGQGVLLEYLPQQQGHTTTSSGCATQIREGGLGKKTAAAGRGSANFWVRHSARVSRQRHTGELFS
jgi:hypothetical protein